MTRGRVCHTPDKQSIAYRGGQDNAGSKNTRIQIEKGESDPL